MSFSALGKRIGHISSLLYYRTMTTWPIWYFLLNRKPRSFWAKHMPRLDKKQEDIVCSLARDGIAITHISEFLPTDDLFSAIQDFVGQKLNETENQEKVRLQHESLMRSLAAAHGKKIRKRDFAVFLWSSMLNPNIDQNSLMCLSLHERLLGVIGHYLGLSPRLHLFNLIRTITMPEGSGEQLAQRWHRDPEDKKMIKVFLYCTDVLDRGAGPFIYVRGSHYGGKWRHLFPQRPPVGHYPQDGAVEKIIPQKDVTVCLGKAGTLIFCDTSGLHKGGYCTAKERVMYTVGYVSRAATIGISYKVPALSEIQKLPALARYALTGEDS